MMNHPLLKLENSITFLLDYENSVMKSLLVLALLSIVLVGFVGYAEAYEGKIKLVLSI